MDDKIKGVAELFNTWQGEGPRTGQQCTIVRFKRCNLHCEFCDIIYKLNNSKEITCTLKDIESHVKSTRYLLITGGEPTLYNKEIYKIFDYFYKSDITIGIETNGVFINSLLKRYSNLLFEKNNGIPPLFKFDIYWSPKIFIDDSHKNINSTTIEWFEKQLVHLINSVVEIYKKLSSKFKYIPQSVDFYLKILCADSLDYEKIIEVSKKYVDNSRIYVMAQGTSPIELMLNSTKVSNIAYRYDVNISTRLHILHVIP